MPAKSRKTKYINAKIKRNDRIEDKYSKVISFDSPVVLLLLSKPSIVSFYYGELNDIQSYSIYHEEREVLERRQTILAVIFQHPSDSACLPITNTIEEM